MALNKRRNASVSASTESAKATQVPNKETSPTPAPNAPNSDFTALQTALASIVQLVTQLNETVTKQASEISDITARLDAIEAAMDEDGEDADEDDEDEDDEDTEDGDDYTADDIDPAKVNDQLHQFKADEQKEILSLAMKALGTNRLNPRIIAKDANAAYAVADVLCSEKFGCDVEDMIKD